MKRLKKLAGMLCILSSSREDMVEWINGLGLDVEAK